MMNEKQCREAKDICLTRLRDALPRYKDRLCAVDDRLWGYASGIAYMTEDVHCLQECLCLYKFLRMTDTYGIDASTVKDILYDAEGEWENGRHKAGGLKIDGIYGYTYYRQTPMQVYALAYIYGFKAWVDTTSRIGTREMLPTEREGNDGNIEDYRRVLKNFVLLWPRKVAKTFMGAFVQYVGLMRGERDYEGYICANSAQQSSLLFKQLKGFITQKEGYERWFRITDTDQHRIIQWREHSGLSAMVQALTAGKGSKDGLKAACCSADEFGGARRVKDHCDMESLINVVEGSMGPRREPLTVHTSTAGLGTDTPYEILIRNFEAALLKELDTPLDGLPHTTTNDWQAGIILRPDIWEYDDDSLRTERVIRKVNPNLGITIQPDFYAKEWAAADLKGELKRKEVVTKLYNVFQSDKAVDWITADEIRPLQTDMRIDDCKADEGWTVYMGMDYSGGKDLHAISYLACREREDGSRELFADMDAWITEKTLCESSIGALLQTWIDNGWLHVSTGNVLNPTLMVQRITELADKGVYSSGFGYDPNKGEMVITALRSWIYATTDGDEEACKYYLQAVGQTNASYNPMTERVEYAVRNDPPMIHFSMNPLWPYEFQCAKLDIDTRMENAKPVKSNPGSDACLVDNVQALCNAFKIQEIRDNDV